MRALLCDQFGDPTTQIGQGILRVANDVPQPKLPAGFVRISIEAASLNFPDALQMKGEYQVKPKLPFVPGSELSGTISELGKGVRQFKVGDRVVAIVSGGAFASECVAHEGSVWLVPDGVEPTVAACVPVAYGTADLSLRFRAGLKPGQTVLVLGAAGGVGTAAVQISKAVGARVIAIVDGASKVDFIKSQGADVVLDSSAAGEPMHKQLKSCCPKGADVVFDPVGGSLFSDAMKSVAWGAQYLVIGFASGTIPKVPANILLVKNVTMHGIFWGSYLERHPALLRGSMDQVLTWVADGKLRPHISHRFTLEDVPEAVRVLLARKVLGKVLIMPGNVPSKL